MASSDEQLTARARDGTPLAVSIVGTGPPLLLIPGLGSGRRVYAPITPALAARCRVTVFDPRGIGDSGIGGEQWTMALLADDARSVLDAAGCAGASVFGASMGGMVAQRLAIDHPERVDRLVLAATNPGGSHMVRPDPANAAALMGQGARTPADAYRLASTVLYGGPFQQTHPGFIDAQVAERGRHPVRARAFRWQTEAVAGHDAYDELPAITAPTLVMHGALDLVSPVQNAEIIAERISDARLVVFADHGHLFFHEAPDESARLIADFVCGGDKR